MNTPHRITGFLACGLMAAFSLAAMAAVPDDTGAEADGPDAAALDFTDDPDAVVLDSVTVTGVQPGPGLWRVSRGDHHLWLIGAVSPVPHNMTWHPAELDERLAQAHAVLQSPGVSMTTGRGRLHALSLAPTAIGLRNNPGRQRLSDVVPPELYARWLELKEHYLGNDRKVERWRPVFAAQRLHAAAVEANAMTRVSPVYARVKEAAEARDLPRVAAELKITIDDPRDALREFKATEVEDVACFEAVLQRLESDIGLLRGRANAWATGDVDALRLLSGADPASACIQALLGVPALARRGLDDLEARVQAAWLLAAERAMYEYPVSVGALPMGEILRPDGPLAQLAARGYVVQAPDEILDDGDDEAYAADDATPYEPEALAD